MNLSFSSLFLPALALLWSPALTLPPRPRAFTLAERSGLTLLHRLRLEDNSAYWLFEDGSTIIFGPPSLTLPARTQDLTLNLERQRLNVKP